MDKIKIFFFFQIKPARLLTIEDNRNVIKELEERGRKVLCGDKENT